MSAPSKETGVAPAQRTRLPRKMERLELRLRPGMKAKLARIAKRRDDELPESYTETVERLILDASEQTGLFA